MGSESVGFEAGTFQGAIIVKQQNKTSRANPPSVRPSMRLSLVFSERNGQNHVSGEFSVDEAHT